MQATPHRVSSLKTILIAVAVANKHSTSVAEFGEVYTWGCNREGQLGYGTTNFASDYVPCAIESLKRSMPCGSLYSKVSYSGSEIRWRGKPKMSCD